MLSSDRAQRLLSANTQEHFEYGHTRCVVRCKRAQPTPSVVQVVCKSGKGPEIPLFHREEIGHVDVCSLQARQAWKTSHHAARDLCVTRVKISRWHSVRTLYMQQHTWLTCTEADKEVGGSNQHAARGSRHRRPRRSQDQLHNDAVFQDWLHDIVMPAHI